MGSLPILWKRNTISLPQMMSNIGGQRHSVGLLLVGVIRSALLFPVWEEALACESNWRRVNVTYRLVALRACSALLQDWSHGHSFKWESLSVPEKENIFTWRGYWIQKRGKAGVTGKMAATVEWFTGRSLYPKVWFSVLRSGFSVDTPRITTTWLTFC